MARQPTITMPSTAARTPPGRQARLEFTGLDDPAVSYRVQGPDPEVAGWCRVLVPAGGDGPGEVVVDVPADARAGRHHLRLVATTGARELAAVPITVQVEGERCLRVLPAPKLSLQADGTVVVSLRVLNCGGVEVSLDLTARHEDGWSFAMDPPELVIDVGTGPVTVKVTLRPPAGQSVERGDRITVEVETGTGWETLAGQVRRFPLAPVAAAALATVVVVAAALVAAGSDGGDTTGTGGAEVTAGSDVSVPTTVNPTGTSPGTSGSPETSGTTASLPELVRLPLVDGLSESEAIETLEEGGFEITGVSREDSLVQPRGSVVRSDPAGGSEVQPGSGVALVVSNGPSIVD